MTNETDWFAQRGNWLAEKEYGNVILSLKTLCARGRRYCVLCRPDAA
jgi:hypothetical protein